MALSITIFVIGMGLGLGLGWIWASAKKGSQLNQMQQHMQQEEARLNQQLLNLSKSEATLQTEKQHLEKENIDLLQQLAHLKQQQLQWQEKEKSLVRLETELETAQKQLADWKENLEKQWKNQFELLSNQTLEKVQQSFEDKAKRDLSERQDQINKDVKLLLEPLQKMITENATQVKESLEQTTGLKKHLELSFQQTKELVEAKNKIVSVLTDNKGRGDWGEFQLMKLLEMSGLVKDRDYFYQQAQSDQARPDIKINLPNGNCLFIDAKTLVGKIEAFESEMDTLTTDQSRKSRTESLIKEIRGLSKRDYQGKETDSVDFVILFVPRESMLRIPLEEDPTLLDEAFRRGVILSSPLILMGLLKTVAQGWAHAKVADHAKEVLYLGTELHKRACTFMTKFEKMEKALQTLQKETDEVRVSLNGRLGIVPQIQKLEQLGAKSQNNLPEKYRLSLNEAPDLSLTEPLDYQPLLETGLLTQ
jgi:DNA recombination protein RmuC